MAVNTAAIAPKLSMALSVCHCRADATGALFGTNGYYGQYITGTDRTQPSYGYNEDLIRGPANDLPGPGFKDGQMKHPDQILILGDSQGVLGG